MKERWAPLTKLCSLVCTTNDKGIALKYLDSLVGGSEARLQDADQVAIFNWLWYSSLTPCPSAKTRDTGTVAIVNCVLGFTVQEGERQLQKLRREYGMCVS